MWVWLVDEWCEQSPPPREKIYTFLNLLGGDDLRVLVWNVSRLMNGDCKYVAMTTVHNSNIFSLSVSFDDSYVYSSG